MLFPVISLAMEESKKENMCMSKRELFESLCRTVNETEKLYSTILEVTKKLAEEECDLEDLITFAFAVFARVRGDRSSILFRGLYLSPYTEDLMAETEKQDFARGISYNDGAMIQIYQQIAQADGKFISKYKKHLYIYREYFFYQGKYGSLFVDMLRFTDRSDKKLNEAILAEIEENTEIPQEDFSEFEEYVRESNFDRDLFFTMLEKLTGEQKIAILNAAAGKVPIGIQQIGALSEESRFDAVAKLGADNSRVINFIKNQMSDSMLRYPGKAIEMLWKLSEASLSDERKKALKEIAEKLPNPELVIWGMDCRPRTFGYYTSSLNCDNISGTKYDPVMLASFLRYARMKFEVNLFPTSYRVECYGYVGEMCFGHVNYNPGSDSAGIFRYPASDHIYMDRVSVFAATLIEACRQSLPEEYDKAIKEAEESVREEIRRREIADLKDGLDILSVQIQPEDGPVNIRPTTQYLECRFSTYESSMGERFCVSFKIGKVGSKSYVVKNATDFWRIFGNGTTVVYGKEAFVYSKENFDDFSSEIIDLFMLLPEINGKYLNDARFYPLRAFAAEKLFRMHVGRTVYFDDIPYEVSDEVPEQAITVSDDYVISNSLYAQDRKLYNLKNSLLCLDAGTGKAYIIPGDKDYRHLAYFAFHHQGTSMAPLADQFASEIYPVLGNRMQLSDEMRRELNKTLLIIKAYFDYVDDTITCKTEIYKGTKKLKPSSVKNSADKAKYTRYLDYLQAFGFEDDRLEGDAVYDFLQADLTNLKKVAEVYLSDTLARKNVMKFVPQSVRIQYENNMMSAMVSSGEYSDEDLAAVLKAIKRKKKYVPVSGDRIIRTDDNEAIEFGETIEDLALDQDNLSESHKISTAQALRAFAHEQNCEINDYLKKMMEAVRNFQNDDAPLPALESELRDYQKDGFRWMNILSRYGLGGILADDMGLGKTIEMIALIKADEAAQPSLIVCPKSVVFNWKNEFARFAPDIIVSEIYGSVSERKKMLSSLPENEKTVYITSYDSLRNDIEQYKSIPFNYLVLDEAQYIKNVAAQKSKSVKRLNARHCFALTGTPIENSVLDLWSIFDFIMPGYLENLTSFKSKYTKDERYHAKIVKSVAPFILRRTKEKVLTSLPEKYEKILSAEMTTEQKKLYEAEKKLARDAIKNGRAFDVLPWLTRLRQICVDPATCIDEYTGGSGKMSLLEETVKQYVEEGHRMIIFSQFVKALDIVNERLHAQNIACSMIIGATSSEKRLEIAEKFNAGEGEPVILISLKAGGTGLNLIGADTVIHLDPWWNSAAENQATDRAYRIGQTRNVEVIKIICENTIEQKVIELQQMKNKVVDEFISNDESSVISARLEDISFILG